MEEERQEAELGGRETPPAGSGGGHPAPYHQTPVGARRRLHQSLQVGLWRESDGRRAPTARGGEEEEETRRKGLLKKKNNTNKRQFKKIRPGCRLGDDVILQFGEG